MKAQSTRAAPRLYTKDLCRRVTLRLDGPLAGFISEQSTGAGTTPSEWVRMVLHSYMNAVKGALGLVDPLLPKASSGKAAKHANQATD